MAAITREVLEAQLGLYAKGKRQAEANLNASNGAIEAVGNLLNILSKLEEAEGKSDESPPPDES